MFGIQTGFLVLFATQIVTFVGVALLTWFFTRDHALSKRLLLVTGNLALWGALWTLFGNFIGNLPAFLQVAAISFGFLVLAEKS